MKITKYNVCTDKQGIDIKIACVADLHARDPQKVLKALKTIAPDVILLAGDIMEVANKYMEKRNLNAKRFLKETSKIAQCFYCFGNHEMYFSHAIKEKNRLPEDVMQSEYLSYINELGIHLVNDRFEEIKTAKLVVRTLGLRKGGIEVVSCPTCGRTKIDLIGLANKVETMVAEFPLDIKVAVMGCVVNGPGEAKEADIGMAGGKEIGILFKKGEIVKKVPMGEIVDELMKMAYEI